MLALDSPDRVSENADRSPSEIVDAVLRHVSTHVGRALLEQGDIDGALEEYANSGTVPAPALVREAADRLLGSGFASDALKLLRAVGADPTYLNDLADRAWRRGDVILALDLYAIAENTERLQEAGEELLRQGAWAGFRAFHYLKMDPPREAALAYAERWIVTPGGLHFALEQYAKLGVGPPPDATLARAEEELRRGHYEQALSGYAAINIDTPDDILRWFAKQYPDSQHSVDALMRLGAREELIALGATRETKGLYYDAMRIYVAANAPAQIDALVRSLSAAGDEEYLISVLEVGRQADRLHELGDRLLRRDDTADRGYRFLAAAARVRLADRV